MAIATLEAIARKPRSATTTWHCIANCLAGANAPTEWPPAGRAHVCTQSRSIKRDLRPVALMMQGCSQSMRHSQLLSLLCVCVCVCVCSCANYADEACITCDDGFFLDPSQGACLGNMSRVHAPSSLTPSLYAYAAVKQCTCANGVGAVGTRCVHVLI